MAELTTGWNPQCHHCGSTWNDHYNFDIDPDDPARHGWNIDPDGTATCADCEWIADINRPKETR